VRDGARAQLGAQLLQRALHLVRVSVRVRVRAKVWVSAVLQNFR